jgi:hypothetical protein
VPDLGLDPLDAGFELRVLHLIQFHVRVPHVVGVHPQREVDQLPLVRSDLRQRVPSLDSWLYPYRVVMALVQLTLDPPVHIADGLP